MVKLANAVNGRTVCVLDEDMIPVIYVNHVRPIPYRDFDLMADFDIVDLADHR